MTDTKTVKYIYKNDGYKNLGSLIKKQRQNYKFIRKVYKNVLHLKEKDKTLSLPVHFEWLCDNYYIIARELKYINKCLHNTGGLPSVRNGSSSYPRIYTYLCDFMQDFNAELQDETLEKYIESVQNNRNYFTTAELSLTGIMLSCTICDKIAGICAVLNDYLYKKVPSLSDELAYAIGYAVKNLRFCGVYSFEKLFAKCSKVDDILSRDTTYPVCDRKTKNLYRHRISVTAKKRGIDEITLAEEITAKAAAENRHIGHYLTKKTPRRLYFFNIAAITALLFALSVKFSGLLAVLLIFPLWELAKQFTDFLFSRAVGAAPMPRLELVTVPDDKKTLVCITTLLFGEGKDDKLYERLELFYHSNKDKNIKFMILGDFKDNKDRHTGNDEIIRNYSQKRINELNEKYDNSFCLLLRGRVYSETQGRYMGWERKRGALIELVRFIKTGEGLHAGFHPDSAGYTFIGDHEFLNEVKYVVTLDADTNLSIDSVKEMLAVMLHPNATPVIDEEKNIVTEGYGVLQPRMGVELASAAKTPFTSMLSGAGGIDIYESAAFDLYQEIYGEGIFCGKGIFDADAFYKTIDKAYPEDAVLSHDLIEGTRLRAGIISDIELTDSIPANVLSYYDRLHRWIRGDVQACFFAGKYVYNADRVKVKNPVNRLSKFKIADNLRRALTPVFTLIFLCAALFSDKSAVPVFMSLAALFYIMFPFFAGIFSLMTVSSFQNVSKKFVSKVTTSIWQSITGVLFELCALAYKALLSLHAVTVTLWRKLITGKNLMSWQTASELDIRLTGFWLYLKKMLPSMLIGAAFIVFSNYGFYKVLGGMWFFFPVIAYVISDEKKSSSPYRNTPSADKQIREYVGDMWKFYSATVKKTDNYLPPDNLQLYPAESTAHRTSPTNIGLYLLSLLAARDFGIIDTNVLNMKLSVTITTIERMKKWEGHLYNWYDTKTLEIIGTRFISTVDSGNFAACLTALKEGIKEYTHECENLTSLIKKTEYLLENINFRVLYNTERELFYIGYDEEQKTFGQNCYDLYMSEAKITSYLAVARREVPKKHWSRLSRLLIKSGGYMGLASWTGTAFEYFMTNLLLPLYKNSLSYEAHKFALREQIKRCAYYNGTAVWGISESGFFSFDFDMNYQYQAFGVQKLGLKRGLNKDLVISPYSTFLALSISPNIAMQNLKRLKKIGMYGKYGFYEAADFTKSRVGDGIGIVKSYMAHHVGMSIIACANLCYNNIFQRRFMSDKIQWSANELLQEKIPVDSIIFEDVNKHEVPEKINRSYGYIQAKSSVIDFENPVCSMISNAKTGIISSSLGHIQMSDGQLALNYCNFNRYNTERIFTVLFRTDNKIYSSSKIPFNHENAEYMYEFSNTSAFYSVKSGNENGYMTGETKFTVSPDTSCYTITLNVKTNDIKSKSRKTKESEASLPEALLYFEPVMARLADYNAHPAFSSLSIEAEYTDGILLYKRRPRLESEVEYYIAVEADGKYTFESRRDEILPHGYCTEDFKLLFDMDFKNTVGACINPICALKTKLIKSDDGRYYARFNIAFAKSKEEAIQIISNSRKADDEKDRLKLENVTKNRQMIAGLTQNEKILYDNILSSMYCNTVYNKPDMTALAGLETSVKVLWKEGISGDLPVILLNLKSDGNLKSIEAYLHIYKFLTLSYQAADLVIIYEEKEKYSRPCYNQIKDLLKANACEQFLKRKGGIFILNAEFLSFEQIQLLNVMAAYKSDISEFAPVGTMLTRHGTDNTVTVLPQVIHYNNISAGNLSFAASEDSIVIDTAAKKAPWSHILTNHNFGTLVTHTSLGFTWFTNARERRITPWENDPVRSMRGERLIMSVGREKIDLCASASKFVISVNSAEYYGMVKGVEYKITVYVDAKLSIKIIETEFTGSGILTVDYVVTPCMGVARTRYNTLEYTENDGGSIHFRNTCNMDFNRYTGFVKSLGGGVTACDYMRFLSDGNIDFRNFDCSAVGKTIRLSEEKTSEKAIFVLGCYKSRKNYEYIEKRLNDRGYMQNVQRNSIALIQNYLPEFRLHSPDESLNIMVNKWLPYQNITSRILARTGFYQSSGAYGYRDQLQDMCGIIYSAPELVRTHIYRAAAHQFIEGDVQHWWHGIRMTGDEPDSAHRGVRTRCSDDYLWLPYVVARYIRITGDKSILDVKVRYITDSPLKAHEKERYSQPKKSDVYGSIFDHCIKALDYVKFGGRGLPLIGTCDWNDGMSLVGADGRGESVWLAMFLIMVLRDFMPVCEAAGKPDLSVKYGQTADNIVRNIEDNCFEDIQYLRGFYDDGTKLGSRYNDECKIDLLPQAFSAIIGLNSERVKISLNSAYNELYDEKAKILKLFTPPFINGTQNPGYIKGYVAGIRENGGQYTHAAVWGALGFMRAGDIDRAVKILTSLNPMKRCEDGTLAEMYRIEPYALSGDVYSNPGHSGRGGWSLYTGAAAWYFRVIFEELCGIDIQSGNPGFKPKLPSGWETYEYTVKVNGIQYSVKIDGERITVDAN